VAYPTDKFDEETLPDPELNPLLNPVLGAHMGRWAEVYFTTPPEKRGQAVSDLLRELKSEAPAEPVFVPPASPPTRPERPEALRTELSRTELPSVDVPPAMPPVPERPRLTCSACSADNPEEKRFCGMCGAPLHPAQPEAFHAEPRHMEERRAETSQVREIDHPPQRNWIASQSSSGRYGSGYAAESLVRSNGYGHQEESEQYWPLAEADLPHFAMESEPVNYRYRLYVGIAVGLLLGVLVYMKWQGNGSFSGDTSESAPARVMPAAPTPAPSSTPSAAPPATNQTTAAPRTVLPTDGQTAAPSTAAPAAVAPDRTRAAETKGQADPGSEQGQARPARASGRVVPAAETSSAAAANDASGGEEFATAEKYLSRSQGASRDNREAAQWLWKAVGKGNLAATMTLSDLYLRGDGVAKSCDQARLLLYAAARKGKTAAAERLRHLQAFGCQ